MNDILMLIGPTMGVLAGATIDEKSLIPLGAAAGVVVTVIALTRRVTKWEDAIESNTKMVQGMTKMMEVHTRQISNLKTTIASLPCEQRRTCGGTPAPKIEM